MRRWVATATSPVFEAENADEAVNEAKLLATDDYDFFVVEQDVLKVKFVNGPLAGMERTLPEPLNERVKSKGTTYRLIPDPWTGENTTYFAEPDEG